MSKPTAFVGSSKEGLEFARAARSLLADAAELTLWNEGFFTPGSSYVEVLVDSLPRFDFAVLVMTPDDLVQSRDVQAFGPRDNVIFELGLFMGHLGRSRTFVLSQAQVAMKIPSDLAGVVSATYDWPRRDDNHQAALGAACDRLRNVIRDLGLSPARAGKQLDEVKEQSRKIQEQLDVVSGRVQKLFLMSMSPEMYLNLEKLSRPGGFGPFVRNPGLERELRYLRDIGYVSVRGVGTLPPFGENLSDYAKITPLGAEFVATRGSMTAEPETTSPGG